MRASAATRRSLACEENRCRERTVLPACSPARPMPASSSRVRQVEQRVADAGIGAQRLPQLRERRALDDRDRRLRDVALRQLGEQLRQRDAACDLVAAGLDRAVRRLRTRARRSATPGGGSTPAAASSRATLASVAPVFTSKSYGDARQRQAARSSRCQPSAPAAASGDDEQARASEQAARRRRKRRMRGSADYNRRMDAVPTRTHPCAAPCAGAASR